MMFQDDQPQLLVGTNAALVREKSATRVVLDQNETCLAVLNNVYTTLNGKQDCKGLSSVVGSLLVTSSRIVFAADNEGELFDLSIDAGLVLLHAVAEGSIYCQLDIHADSDGQDELIEENGQIEEIEETIDEAIYDSVEIYFSLKPFGSASTDNTTKDDIVSDDISVIEEELGQIFDALSTMIELNPDDKNDDEDEGFENEGFFFAADSDKIIQEVRHNDAEATDEERTAMLEKLDAMLVVPPELELDENGQRIIDDQFADAEEDDLL